MPKELNIKKSKGKFIIDNDEEQTVDIYEEYKENVRSEIAKDRMSTNRRSTGVKNLNLDFKRDRSNKNLDRKVKDIPKKKSKVKKALKISLFIFIFLFVFFGILTYYYIVTPLRNIRNSAYNIRDEALAMVADFDDKDLSKIDERFKTMKSDIDYINSEIDRFDFLANSKYTKGYYDNLQVVSNIMDKTDILLDTTLPELKNVLQLTGFKTEENQTTPEGIIPEANQGAEAEEEPGAISLIMGEMPRYLQLYETIEPSIYDIFAEINKLNPDYIPNIGSYNFKEKLTSTKKFIQKYPETADQVTGFLAYMPKLMGADSKATYLLILQNETEMRASGGLLTAFGTMQIENGELKNDITLSDMWNLENYVSYTLGIDVGYRNIYGQNVLMNLGCGSTYLRAQDSGIYPDLNWTMTTFADYYDVANEYNPEEYPDYDHILIINHYFAESLIGLIQPLQVEGAGEVTKDNLFEFIKTSTDNPELSYDPERKAILGDIANAAKKKFFEKDLSELPEIINILVKGFYARDIAIASEKDPDLQTFLDQYDMSGRFDLGTFDGDNFHLNEAQNCSLKLNKWVRDEVTQDIYINDDGSISKDIKVRWEQPQVYNESLKNHYSPTLKFTYRAWVRIFTPIEVASYDSDGYTQSGYVGYFPQEYNDEVMNMAVSDNIIQFDHRRLSDEDPIPEQTLEVAYDLPESINYINDGSRYKMLIQKHPGKSWGEKYHININYQGKVYSIEFILDQDKVLTFRNGIIRIDNYHQELDWVLDLVGDIPFDDIASKD